MDVTVEKLIVWVLAIIVALVVIVFLVSMLGKNSSLITGFNETLRSAPSQTTP